MRTTSTLLSLTAFAVILAGCQKAPVSADPKLLENPLYAEYYYDDLVERLVNLDIQNDPLLEDKSKRGFVDTARRNALQKAKEATRKQDEGLMGSFVPVTEFTGGEVLLLEQTLYFGPTFETAASPDLHVYLSETVDPRDTAFPDPSAIDIGIVKNPYGPQAFDGIQVASGSVIRSIVLWDNSLERLNGFAQVSGR